MSVIVLCVSQYEAHLSPAAIGFGHRSAKEKAEFLRFGYLRLSSVIFWAFFMFLIFGSRFWFRCSHINRRFLRPILPGTMSLVFCFEFCFVLFVFFSFFRWLPVFIFPNGFRGGHNLCQARMHAIQSNFQNFQVDFQVELISFPFRLCFFWHLFY